jgi:superkiller protein 3
MQLCATLKRLIAATLSNECYHNSPHTKLCRYQKCILLLCVSEVSFQLGDYPSSVKYAIDALHLPEVSVDTFFVHLQLCRLYGFQGKVTELKTEFNNCLLKGTASELGWVMLKYVESRFKLENTSDVIVSRIRECTEGNGSQSNVWAAMFYLACAQCFVWEEDFVSAELALGQACVEVGGEGYFFLCHGKL